MGAHHFMWEKCIVPLGIKVMILSCLMSAPFGFSAGQRASELSSTLAILRNSSFLKSIIRTLNFPIDTEAIIKDQFCYLEENVNDSLVCLAKGPGS